MSFQMKLINAALSLTVKPILGIIPFNKFTLGVPRKMLKIIGGISPPDRQAHVTTKDAHHVPIEFIEYHLNVSKNRAKIILYLHGGGYLAGSPLTHRNITTRLSHYAECTVVAVDYRKSPEHPYPAALNDAVEVYQWLIESGYLPENIIIAGDSAGGNLTLITALAIRDRHLPRCAGLICISPWADLSSAGSTHVTNKRHDPMIPTHRVMDAAQLYANDIPLNDPRVSPLYADLHDLPPTLIHVGDREVLLSDSLSLHQRIKESGGESELKIWKDCPHVFQLFAGLAPQSKQSIREMCMFATRCWSNYS